MKYIQKDLLNVIILIETIHPFKYILKIFETYEQKPIFSLLYFLSLRAYNYTFDQKMTLI